MEALLLKLLLAHILGDFFFQPSAWVANKEKRKLKSSKLYFHILIHVSLIFLLFWSFKVWPLALLIGGSHFAIDALKLIFQREKTKRFWFFGDQISHIAVIFVCATYLSGASINFLIVQQPKFLVYVFSVLLLTLPSAILIKMAIAKWIPVGNDKNSLHDAGKFIGMLERLLIFLFVCTHHFEAVGFLLAAKSIFRFGDLKDAHDIKLTEYVLIGTLLSFGIALLVALSVVSFF